MQISLLAWAGNPDAGEPDDLLADMAAELTHNLRRANPGAEATAALDEAAQGWQFGKH